MKYVSTPTARPSRLLNQSLAACKWWIETEWSRRVETPRLRSAFSVAQQDEQQAAAANGLNRGANGEQLYPLVTFILTLIGERQAPYLPWQTQFVGIPVGYTPGRLSQIVEKIKPIEVGLGIRFQCMDIQEAIAFATMWVENQPNTSVDIKNGASGAVFRIHLDLNSGPISMPQADAGQQGEPLPIETSLICRTYCGTTELQEVVRSLQLGTMAGSILNPDAAVELDSVTFDYASRYPRT